MIRYNLQKQISGEKLISILVKTSKHFDYNIEITPIKNLRGALQEEILFRGFFLYPAMRKFRINDIPISKADPNLKNIRISDVQEHNTIWTAETTINPNLDYNRLDFNLYKEDGIYAIATMVGVYFCRDKPIRLKRQILQHKPVIDGLMGKLKEHL